MKGLFLLFSFFIVQPLFSQIITWDRTIDLDQQDYGLGVIQTSDGGYAITGYTGGYYDPDLLICRLDQSCKGTNYFSLPVQNLPNGILQYSIESKNVLMSEKMLRFSLKLDL